LAGRTPVSGPRLRSRYLLRRRAHKRVATVPSPEPHPARFHRGIPVLRGIHELAHSRDSEMRPDHRQQLGFDPTVWAEQTRQAGSFPTTLRRSLLLVGRHTRDWVSGQPADQIAVSEFVPIPDISDPQLVVA